MNCQAVSNNVALARALVFEPDLLLLDEPMSALDKKLRIDLQDQLRDIHHRLGTTFINVTHDQEEAMHMSDGIAVMNHGHIEQYDTGHHLYRKPGSRFVADFIGKSNIFEGALSLTSSGPQFNAAEFTVSGTYLSSAADRIGRADLVVRPEDIRLGLPTDTARTTGDIVLSGMVASSTYSGIGSSIRFLSQTVAQSRPTAARAMGPSQQMHQY